MAILAIKGHTTRSEEVIEILEMLGGVNKWNYICDRTLCTYFINCEGIINYTSNIKGYRLQVFTLEEFLKKFPYKVGDKVKVKETGKDVTIYGMSWRNGCEVIYDTCYNNDCASFHSAEELQPYKEETMDKANKAVFDANSQCCDIMNNLIKEEIMEEIIKIDIPKGYEFAGVDDDNQQVVFEKIGYQYPKTYEECCKILNTCCTMPSRPGYKQSLFSKFQELIICRDAYWKFLTDWWEYPEGWKPNFKDGTMKYTIECHANSIIDCGNDMTQNVILVFPTEEMRDAFYENFKDLIEYCKDFL